jgi:hypothetical protein
MRKSNKLQMLLTLTLCCALATSLVFAAEERPNRGDRGPGGPGGRRGFDPEAMQQRMMQMMQEQLGASDEEWKVIQPRLSEVMTLQQSANVGRRGMRGMFGRRGRGNRGGEEQTAEASTDPVQKAAEELQQTLDKEAPSTTEIQNKLLALRGAREQAKQKLAAAQQKLRDVLSVKQEAQLVLMGMLD